MKKLLFLCSLLIPIIFSQSIYVIAGNELPENTTEIVISGPITSSEKATSKATISFSTKNIKSDIGVAPEEHGNHTSVGRLPSTGETVGMGLSLLGFLLLFVIFQKEIKNINKIKEKI